MEGRSRALVAWLEAVAATPITTITHLRDCRLIEQVLGQIEGFSFEGEGRAGGEWKENYARLKQVYEQVQSYLVGILRVTPPSSLTVMNLVEMAKGESQEGLQSLLLLVFIVCILSPIKQSFIHPIMKLPQALQLDLMQITQEWQAPEEVQKEEERELDRYKHQIARIQYLYKNLVEENTSLRLSLEELDQRAAKGDETIMRLREENEGLQRELSEKAEQLRLREENFLDKYAQHNEDLVQQLKKRLLDQESEFAHEALRLRQTIQSLQWSAGQAQRQASELQQEQARRHLLQSRDEHINCITIQKHKLKVNELLALNKEAKQTEIAIKLENVQLKSRISELQLKLKKQGEELRKKDQDFMINTEDASKLKIQFFTRVRDSLKKKFLDYKAKENQEALAGKLEFDDEP